MSSSDIIYPMSSILDQLNQEQAKAAQTINGPVLIIAGAGSGKTRALTHRLAYLVEQGVRPENILALTFTNKAAQEMKTRVEKLLHRDLQAPSSKIQVPSFVGTFHSLAAKILRHEIHHLGRGADFTIYDDKDSLACVKEAMADLALSSERFKPGAIAAIISKQKNELVDAETYQRAAQDFYEQTVSRVYAQYQNYLNQANAVDFDDLLLLAVKIFQKFPPVLERYQNQFQYILVDEYQDTNQAQYVFLKLLAQKHKNLCVVGDDFQAIYSFRGSDFRNILNFEKDYPEAKIIKLEENYRSVQNILDASQAIIEKNTYKTDKRLWTRRGQGDKLKIVEAFSEIDEANFVVQEIKDILAEESLAKDLNDFVVLYRTNAQSRVFEEALMQEGWPYRLVGALKFYERKEVKDIISYLRFIQNHNDLLSLKRIINIPSRGIGKVGWEKLASSPGLTSANPKIQSFLALIAELKDLAAQKKPSEFLKTLLAKINYKNYLADFVSNSPAEYRSAEEAAESRWQNVLELVSVAAKFDRLPPPLGLTALLEEIALTASADDVSHDQGELNLMTLHSAKGLEFPVVFMVGTEEGLLPHSRSFYDTAQMEEERRLAYVGLTRAKERAYISFACQRNLYGRTESAMPSRFLDDIPEKLIEFVSLVA